MAQLIPFQLEEHVGHKFYVEFVGSVPMGYWFRIHMVHRTHDFTIETNESIEEAKKEVIHQFKQYLEENHYYRKSV
jgi:hypothetical protein